MSRFRRGERVVMTDEGRRLINPHHHRSVITATGVVTGPGRSGPGYVRVRRDGHKHAELFAAKFWIKMGTP